MAKRQRKYRSGTKYKTTGPSGRSGSVKKVGTLKIAGKTYLIIRQLKKRKKSN